MDIRFGSWGKECYIEPNRKNDMRKVKDELEKGNWVAFRIEGNDGFFKMTDNIICKHNVRVGEVVEFGLCGVSLETKDIFNAVNKHYIKYSDITILN